MQWDFLDKKFTSMIKKCIILLYYHDEDEEEDSEDDDDDDDDDDDEKFTKYYGNVCCVTNTGEIISSYSFSRLLCLSSFLLFVVLLFFPLMLSSLSVSASLTSLVEICDYAENDDTNDEWTDDNDTDDNGDC